MKNIKFLTYLFFSSIILCLIAFINQYPLVTSDTGAYIGNIYGNIIPRDRPITYSIFLLISSLRISLWLPILIQSIWISYLIYLLVKNLIPTIKTLQISFILISILSFFTSLSWYSSQLMADIFTGINFLCLYLLVLGFYYNEKKTKYFLWGSLFVSLLMHNSNILISFLFLILLLIFLQLKKEYRATIKIKSSLGIVFISWFTISLAHLFGGYGFTMSRTSDVFLMGKMSENGVLHKYLYNNCHDNTLYLCQFKDALPQYGWEYIWNEDSPLNSKGHWDESKKENQQILKDIFTTPKYLAFYAFKCIVDAFKQFFSYRIGDGLNPHLENSNTYWQIHNLYHSELIDYKKSLQNKDAFDFDFYNNFQFIFLLFSIVIALCSSLKDSKLPQNIIILLFLTFLFLCLNAFITANLANVLSRLQSRIIWLIPMACWIVIIFNLTPKKLFIHEENSTL